MNLKLLRYVILILTLVFQLVFTGCVAISSTDKPETANQDVIQESPDDATLEVTLYEKYGLTIGIPNEIIDNLMVISEPKWETFEDTYLFSVYEKRSFEEAWIKYPESYAGYLFTIVRYTKAQYEQFLCSDASGQSFFAKDDIYYYGWFVPTDVQFYFEGNLDMQSDEWKEWVDLNEKCKAIKDDFIVRNNLDAYSDSEFWDREYTYDSKHIILSYYPYYEYDGSKEEVWTIILSQPATQGDTGIWCVERWKDQYGNIYPYFPDNKGTPSDEYYTNLQKECNAGKEFDWLEPEQVALKFVKSVFEHNMATLDSFSVSDNSSEPYGFFAASTGDIHDYMPKLLAGEVVSDYKLLLCLENFTHDIWHELDI